jgi:hypothetical protein
MAGLTTGTAREAGEVPRAANNSDAYDAEAAGWESWVGSALDVV